MYYLTPPERLKLEILPTLSIGEDMLQTELSKIAADCIKEYYHFARASYFLKPTIHLPMKQQFHAQVGQSGGGVEELQGGRRKLSDMQKIFYNLSH